MFRIPSAIILLLSATAFAQQPEPQYEMDHYVVGFLKKGPNWSAQQTEELKKMMAGHMANLRRMGLTGKLVVAGPFEDKGDLAGMFIFKCSLEDAQREASQDPAVQAGRFVLELHPWFAAKGIKVNPPK